MNLSNLSLFLFAALFFMIASQAGYFFTGYYKVLQGMSTMDFMLIRKSTDAAVRTSYKFLYISAMLAGIAVLVLHRNELGSVRGTLMCIAVFFLLADLVLAKTVSEPVNSIIGNTPMEQLINMPGLQEKWLNMILVRGALSLAGFLLLMSSLAFASRY